MQGSNWFQHKAKRGKTRNRWIIIFFVPSLLIKAPELAEIWRIFEFAWGNRDSEENASALASMQPLAIEDGEVDDDDDDYNDVAVDPSQEGEIPTEVTEPEHEEPAEIENSVEEVDGTSSVATTHQDQSPEDNLPSSQIPEMTRAEYKKWAEENPNMAQKNMDGTQPGHYSPASPPTPILKLLVLPCRHQLLQVLQPCSARRRSKKGLQSWGGVDPSSKLDSLNRE